jgi:putative ABC transport system ATP-binding protein
VRRWKLGARGILLESKDGSSGFGNLVRLNECSGLTIVVVTHEPDVARYARRVVHFKDGVVISDAFNDEPMAA